MAEINLLHSYPRSKRPIEERGMRKLSGDGWIQEEYREDLDPEGIVMEQLLINTARKFGREYFDGDRLYGYGGYRYDPRFWEATAQVFREHYGLPDTASILDVGCAKGFLLHDFRSLMPRAEVAGLDISEYAYENSMPEVRPYIKVGSAAKLPYADRSFDLVISINTVDHLPLDECRKAIQELQRVSRKHCYLTVNAWRSEEERQRLLKWNITAQTCMHVDDWKRLFEQVGYRGDFYWFIAE